MTENPPSSSYKTNRKVRAGKLLSNRRMQIFRTAQNTPRNNGNAYYKKRSYSSSTISSSSSSSNSIDKSAIVVSGQGIPKLVRIEQNLSEKVKLSLSLSFFLPSSTIDCTHLRRIISLTVNSPPKEISSSKKRAVSITI